MSQQIGIRVWIKDLWKSKRLQSIHDEDKMNFNLRWSQLLSYRDVIQKECIMVRSNIDLMKFARLLENVILFYKEYCI